MKDKLKKIAALTGSAVMLGATMLGAVAVGFDTFTAKNGVFYTTGGELNAFVGIGTGAAVSDVAGAIDVAAAMAQSATIGGEEGAIVERNVTAGVLESTTDLGYIEIDNKNLDATFTPSSEGFEWLYNSTGTYTELESGNRDTLAYNLYETIFVDNGFYVYSTGKARLGKGDLVYNLTTNGTALKIGMDKFKLLGTNYQIVDYNDTTHDWVKLGVLEDLEKIPMNTKTDIGDSGASFEIVNKYYDGTNQWVTINFYDEDDNLAAQEDMKLNDEYDNDTLGIVVSVTKIADYEIGGLQTDLQYETTGIMVEDGEAAEFLGKINDKYAWEYEVFVDTNGVQYIAIKNDQYLPEGTYSSQGTYPILNDYFKIYYDGLKIDSDDETETILTLVLESSTYELEFEDENETSIEVNLASVDYDDWDAGSSRQAELYGGDYIFTCQNDTAYAWGHVNLTIELPDETFVYMNNTGTQLLDWIYYNITWDENQVYSSKCSGGLYIEVFNFTTADKMGYLFGENLTFAITDDTSATLTLTEPDTQTVVVALMNDSNKGWYFDDSDDIVDSSGKDLDATESGYSVYGTALDLDLTSDNEGTLTMTYPEAQRYGDVSVGLKTPAEYTLTLNTYDKDLDLTLISGGGATVKEIFATGDTTASGLAKLDTEYNDNAPVVLVGGPVANSKVQSLVTAGKAMQNITAGGPEANHAYVEYVEDAFGTYDAVVIAGYGATETRLACRVFASQILHGTPLTTFTGMQLNLNFAEAGGDFKLVASEDW